MAIIMGTRVNISRTTLLYWLALSVFLISIVSRYWNATPPDAGLSNTSVRPAQSLQTEQHSRMPFRYFDDKENGYVAGLGFSPDGKLVVRVTTGAVSLWDVAKGVVVRTLDPRSPTEGFRALSFSPSGQYLAMIFGGQVNVWDLDGTSANPISSFRYDNSEDYLVATDDREIITAYRVRDFEGTSIGEPRWVEDARDELQGRFINIRSRFSSNGDFVIVSEGSEHKESAKLYSVRTDAFVKKIDLSSRLAKESLPLNVVAVSNDGERFVLLEKSIFYVVYDIKGTRPIEIGRLALAHSGVLAPFSSSRTSSQQEFPKIRVSPSARYIAVFNKLSQSSSVGFNSIMIWVVDNKSSIRSYVDSGFLSHSPAFDFSPDEALFAAGDNRGLVQAWMI